MRSVLQRHLRPKPLSFGRGWIASRLNTIDLGCANIGFIRSYTRHCNSRARLDIIDPLPFGPLGPLSAIAPHYNSNSTQNYSMAIDPGTVLLCMYERQWISRREPTHDGS